MTLHRAKPSRRRLRARKQGGVTLIELMIAVAIVSLLAAVVYPSFSDAIRKSRRSDAVTALNAVQTAQERWRSNQPVYADNDQLTLGVTADPPGLGLSATTPNGYYGLVISSPTATGYTVTAVPAEGNGQAQDGACAQLRVRVAGGNIFYGSAVAAGTDFTEGSSNRCWAR
jgi:type IV pilus assembly protein PilE